jgi:hypothetical protein
MQTSKRKLSTQYSCKAEIAIQPTLSEQHNIGAPTCADEPKLLEPRHTTSRLFSFFRLALSW